MSNPTVSFRISDFQLARGLRAIRTIEPHWQLTTPANLIKTIFIDYIAKSEFAHKAPLNLPAELLEEIFNSRAGIIKDISRDQLNTLPRLGITNQTQQLSDEQTQRQARQIQEDIENEKLLQQLKRESKEKQDKKDADTAEQITLASKVSAGTRIKPSEFHDPNITESTISSVTDFSPPPEWKS